MTKSAGNIGASVRARLLKLARARGDDFQLILTRGTRKNGLASSKRVNLRKYLRTVVRSRAKREPWVEEDAKPQKPPKNPIERVLTLSATFRTPMDIAC